MQVLMKENTLESSYFNTEPVIRQLLSVSNKLNSNENNHTHNNINTASNVNNATKLVTVVKQSSNKETSAVTTSKHENTASNNSSSPSTVLSKSIRKNNLKKSNKFVEENNFLEEETNTNITSNNIEVFLNNNLENEKFLDKFDIEMNQLNDNNFKSFKFSTTNINGINQNSLINQTSSNNKNLNSSSSKLINSSKTSNSNSNLNLNKITQQQKNNSSTKPKKNKKKSQAEALANTENDIDIYMQGKSILSSLVKSAINISTQYQNQFSPQNSDILSNSSSNLKSPKKNDKLNKEQKKSKKSTKKSKKKKKPLSSDQAYINSSPNDQLITNLNLIEKKLNDVNLKNNEFSSGSNVMSRNDISKYNNNYSQLKVGIESTASNIKRTASAKRVNNLPSLTDLGNYSNNESLRWHNQLENDDEEQKRIELYKMNRRKRYLDQKNIQLLATLSKAKSILSTTISTPIQIKNDLENASSGRFSVNTQDALYDSVSKINLNDNSIRLASSKSKRFSANNDINNTSLEFVEINNLNLSNNSSSVLQNRPKSEKSFHSTSFILNSKRPHVNDNRISSIISNS